MKQRGFSLAELAIVMVIIGILLTGILNSQGLIGSTKVNDVIAIVDDLRTASVYFKQKYNYLPGDWVYTDNEIPGVVSSVTAVATLGDGDIDGAVDNIQGTATSGTEVSEAPWQLYKAGLLGKLQGDPQRRIMTKYGSVHLVSAATANGLVANFTSANANSSSRNAIVFFNLPCDVVTEVDSKQDDGVTVYVASPGSNGRAFGTGGCGINGSTTVQWYAVAL